MTTTLTGLLFMSDSLKQLHGNWLSKGYNRALCFNESGFRLYTVTTGALSLYDAGSMEEFHAGYDRLEFPDEHTLHLFYTGDLTRYQFQRINDFPGNRALYDGGCRDPLAIFEDFVRVFSENYAFFALHGTNWQQIIEDNRGLVNRETSQEDLANILGTMIAPLKDTHTYVRTGFKEFRSFSVNRGPRQALEKLFALPSPGLSYRSTVDAIAPRIEEVLLKPFSATHTPLRFSANEVISWCRLAPGIGYLNFLRMFGYADSHEHRTAHDLPHKPHYCGPFMEADMLALNATLDEVFDDLTDIKYLVVDSRINGGGFDRAGLELAARLTTEPRVAYRKKAWSGDGFTDLQSIEITPSAGPGFHGPVAFLTCPFNLSAGEVFALIMQALPNATLYGEPSMGILSDNLFHRLPNGWEVSLSNEVYESVDGNCYEAVGVPADIALPLLTETNLAADMQQGLEQAVQFLIR